MLDETELAAMGTAAEAIDRLPEPAARGRVLGALVAHYLPDVGGQAAAGADVLVPPVTHGRNSGHDDDRDNCRACGTGRHAQGGGRPRG